MLKVNFSRISQISARGEKVQNLAHLLNVDMLKACFKELDPHKAAGIDRVMFLDCSYGFRPGRNCHQAVSRLLQHISGCTSYIVEADIRSCFDTIDHDWLIKFLEHDIADRKFIELINRGLKAGHFEEGVFYYHTEGTMQGSGYSPVLANVYLHYTLGTWFRYLKEFAPVELRYRGSTVPGVSPHYIIMYEQPNTPGSEDSGVFASRRYGRFPVKAVKNVIQKVKCHLVLKMAGIIFLTIIIPGIAAVLLTYRYNYKTTKNYMIASNQEMTDLVSHELENVISEITAFPLRPVIFLLTYCPITRDNLPLYFYDLCCF